MSPRRHPTTKSERRDHGDVTAPTRSVQSTRCTCTRCGHVWVVRGEQLPRTCARCRSPYWDRPRQRRDEN